MVPTTTPATNKPIPISMVFSWSLDLDVADRAWFGIRISGVLFRARLGRGCDVRDCDEFRETLHVLQEASPAVEPAIHFTPNAFPLPGRGERWNIPRAEVERENMSGDRGVEREVRIPDQVDADLAAVLSVIAPTRDLDIAAAAEERTVALLCVPQVRATLVELGEILRPAAFFDRSKASRLDADRRDRRDLSRDFGDPMLLESCKDERPILSDRGLGTARSKSRDDCFDFDRLGHRCEIKCFPTSKRIARTVPVPPAMNPARISDRVRRFENPSLELWSPLIFL